MPVVSKAERDVAFAAVMKAVRDRKGALIATMFGRYQNELREAIDVALNAAAQVREREATVAMNRLRLDGGK